MGDVWCSVCAQCSHHFGADCKEKKLGGQKWDFQGDDLFVAWANYPFKIPPVELESQAQLANRCIGFVLFAIISSFTFTGFDFHPAFPIENDEEATG